MKDWLNMVTGNQWFFLEKSMYSFTSSLFLFIFLIGFEPVTEVKLTEPVHHLETQHYPLIAVSCVTLAGGVYYMYRSYSDMWRCDLFGLQTRKYLKA